MVHSRHEKETSRCKAIRLDAYDKHLKLLAWYTKLGYHCRGTFAFYTKLHGETGMACFEKILLRVECTPNLLV